MGQSFKIFAPRRREKFSSCKFAEMLFGDSGFLQRLLAVPVLPSGFGLRSGPREPTYAERNCNSWLKLERPRLVSRSILIQSLFRFTPSTMRCGVGRWLTLAASNCRLTKSSGSKMPLASPWCLADSIICRSSCSCWEYRVPGAVSSSRYGQIDSRRHGDFGTR